MLHHWRPGRPSPGPWRLGGLHARASAWALESLFFRDFKSVSKLLPNFLPLAFAELWRHMKQALEGQPNVFVVSLGDLGESTMCNVPWLAG